MQDIIITILILALIAIAIFAILVYPQQFTALMALGIYYKVSNAYKE